ncbi:NADPH:quinone reductase [Tenacibaculum sediminilitoris]|uniref:NAD(P)-dependent alcohol dehydrogenase n=1 Tax=Tenacibaculum sediminilitoris TaxID=1820334 RepID=UPI0038958A37
MKAIVYNKKHLPFRLQIKEVEKPIPKDNEVLLKVSSVSLNAADYRSMKMGMIPKKRIFGSAVSGTIELVGKNIKHLKSGDEVVGDLTDFGFGGLAEFAVAPEKAFIHKQPNTSFEDSATLPVAATTALKALRDKGNIQKGQNVLIVGSSGGVGIFALQLAKYFGAKVTAVCSSKNIEQSTSLGADEVIDYTKEDITKGSIRYDLIVAINGSYPLLGYRRILNSKGIFVMVGGTLPQILKSIFFGWILSFGGKIMKPLFAKSNPKDLEYVAKLLDQGKIRAIIHKRYALEKAAEAMDYISKGHAPGKVIINIQYNNNEYPTKSKLH